jgi:hypothetical protein
LRLLGTVSRMSDMVYNKFQMGTAEFRIHATASKLRKLLEQHPIVGVARYRDETEAIVLAPKVFESLIQNQEHLVEMKRTLPMLVAALQQGIAIPSDFLESVGITAGDDSWQALNAFQSSTPIYLSESEDGARLTAAHLTPDAPLLCSDEELEELDEDELTNVGS